jgi:hypothetical protein
VRPPGRAENFLKAPLPPDAFSLAKIIATPQRVADWSGAAKTQHGAVFVSHFDRWRTKTVDDVHRTCTFDPRTALAARVQKQRFGVTLIGE